MAEVSLKASNKSKIKKGSLIKRQDGKINWSVTILLIICCDTLIF